MSVKGNESVKVVVRCRPMGAKEESAGYERVVEMSTDNGVVSLRNPNKPDEISREFTFDSVYDWSSKQVNLYDVTFRPIVNAVLEGYNGTIFAYGQTGTGKTYTMEGVRSNPDERGVIPNSFDHIFSHIDSSENQQYLVRASYLEIYKEEIRDLLSKDHKKRLDVGERPDTGVYVKDLSSFIAKSMKEIEHVMSIGNQNRAVGRTDMNEHSSRSHAIFIVTVECAEQGSDGEDHIRVGKLNLVDLAGSERQSKTQSTGDRFKEAIKINLSLSALGNVISALVNPKSRHIPYRDSMLTYLLSDSLGGNSKTVMVANIGPASYNYEETLVTLRYANRAKNIQNKPRINEDPKDALLREYQEEIKRLKETLDQKKGGTRGHRSKHKKKKGRGGEGSGHTDAESPSDSGGEEEEEGGKERLQREREELEKERKLIQENTGMMEEEKLKLLAELQKKVEQVKSESKKMDSLTNKIKTMESKLLSGGTVKISQHEREERKRDIQRKRDEMIEMKKRTEKIQKELEQRDDLNVEVQGSYQTLQEENAAKEKKLKKLQKKLKMAESEIEDCREEQCQYRDELTQQLLLMEKQLKLRQLIIDHLIPLSEVQHVQDSHVYNEGMGAWLPRDTPTSDFNATPTYGPHPSLNEDFLTVVLRLDVDMPTRTTSDYTPQSQLTSPVMDIGGEDSTVDALLFEDHRTKNDRASLNNSRSVKQFTVAMDPKTEFPLSRGLIKHNK